MRLLQLAQERDGLEPGRVPQQWHDFGLPDFRERIVTCTPRARWLLRRRTVVMLNAPSRANAHARHRRGDFLSVMFALAHI